MGDKKIKITKIPFSIFVENIEYMDNPRFNVGDMLHRIEKQDIHTHTACPSPAAWKEAFDQGDHIFAITLSSKVSGSYNSAQVAAAMVQEEAGYPCGGTDGRRCFFRRCCNGIGRL